MSHARVFKNRAVARCRKLRSCTLLVGGGNGTVIGAIAQRETSMRFGRLAIRLTLERRTEQNRRIEHIRVLRNHAIREIPALRKTDQHLAEPLERWGIQELHDTVADLGACAAALADRAAVRVPVIAADVRASMRGAERDVVGVARCGGVCGRGLSGDAAGDIGSGISGVAGDCGVAGGCGVAVGSAVIVTTGIANRVDDANHLGFVVAVPMEPKEQQIVGWGSALLEIDGSRNMQLYGVLLCSGLYHYCR